ncbi:MAG: hypothetical protein ABR559_02115 [Gemmatimonadota bacterium]
MPRGPLVVLGIDGGDPAWLRTWAAEGWLPTLAGVIERGCWGETGGAELISEHGVWVSLFSGVSRGQHGYFYFRQLEPGTYDLRGATGNDLGVAPFWAPRAGSDRRVVTIDVPDVRPLPGLNGLQVADWASHNNWDPAAYPFRTEPSELAAEIVRDYGGPLVTHEVHQNRVITDQAIRETLLNRVARKGALCRNLLARDGIDLAVAVFAESHVANHQFWTYRPEIGGNAPAEAPELATAIREVYAAIDREWGRILARLPADADVVVVSSVGMADDFPTTGLIEDFLRRLGYQVSPNGQGGGSWKPLDLARRVVPEPWRAALSRRLSRPRRERLLAEGFRKGTDWSRTSAFAIPGAYTSFVRVNLRGREPGGIVDPGAEYSALLDRLEADLALLVDPESREPAVDRVIRTTELFGAGAHAALPDLFVEWKPGRFLTRVRHPAADVVQSRPDFYRRSDHSGSGFFAAAGPSISGRGPLATLDALDFAPTCLALLGERVPEELSGKPSSAILEGV